jgi:hypothetical protein
MFLDRVKATLTLTILGTAYTCVAGSLKKFDLELLPWGYRGTAEFWVICVSSASEDTLFAAFVKQDLISVEVSLARAFTEVEATADATPTGLVLQGLVYEKGVLERSFHEVEGQPVFHRRYTIRFADRGYVLWRQHRPTVLYVGKTYKDLIEDNKPDGVTTAYTWTASTTVWPVLSLGLGVMTNDASFYDFLFWLLNRENAGLYYDVAKDQYSFLDTKPTSTAVTISQQEVATIEARFPQLHRETVSVLNSYTDAATAKKDITNAESVTGVSDHYLIRSAVSSDLDNRVTLETSRAQQPQPEAHVELAIFPSKPYTPQMEVKLDSEWSTNIYQSGNTYRVVSVILRGAAVSQEATDDLDEETNRYQLDYVIRLELDADPAVRYPAYVRPAWPFYVEGKVLSEIGADDELTFEPYADATTSINYYKVKIPLWANQEVIVAFEPISLSGHFFFPAYKDERVLVALQFDKAWIRAFLDWRPGGLLPTDTQGNQILVGKKDKNETTINHVYVDSSPVLTIQRTLDTDTQIITVSEGSIKLVTKDH